MIAGQDAQDDDDAGFFVTTRDGYLKVEIHPTDDLEPLELTLPLESCKSALEKLLPLYKEPEDYDLNVDDAPKPVESLPTGDRFREIFGFPNTKPLESLHVPLDGEIYGVAAYGKWGETLSWSYAVGSFDYAWGRYEGYADPAEGIALYLLKDTNLGFRKMELISGLQFSRERAARYEPWCIQGRVITGLCVLPEFFEVDPVDFDNR